MKEAEIIKCVTELHRYQQCTIAASSPKSPAAAWAMAMRGMAQVGMQFPIKRGEIYVRTEGLTDITSGEHYYYCSLMLATARM